MSRKYWPYGDYGNSNCLRVNGSPVYLNTDCHYMWDVLSRVGGNDAFAMSAVVSEVFPEDYQWKDKLKIEVWKVKGEDLGDWAAFELKANVPHDDALRYCCFLEKDCMVSVLKLIKKKADKAFAKYDLQDE